MADNKFRILKNGGVNAVLQAMKNWMEDENIQLNALKLLCNLMESGKNIIMVVMVIILIIVIMIKII